MKKRFVQITLEIESNENTAALAEFFMTDLESVNGSEHNVRVRRVEFFDNLPIEMAQYNFWTVDDIEARKGSQIAKPIRE